MAGIIANDPMKDISCLVSAGTDTDFYLTLVAKRDVCGSHRIRSLSE